MLEVVELGGIGGQYETWLAIALFIERPDETSDDLREEPVQEVALGQRVIGLEVIAPVFRHTDLCAEDQPQIVEGAHPELRRFR